MAATQKFTNSPLVTYVKMSPNHSGKRTMNIDTISIHCVAGNLSVEQVGNIFADKNRKASSNYCVGSDGRIAMYVEECNRSWCTSTPLVDQRAVTIEVSNIENKEPYKVSDKAYESLIKLCADICKRNNIKELKWKCDKSLIYHTEEQNMIPHRWTANKSCLPIYYTELLTKSGWVLLADIRIGDEVATFCKNDMSIRFDKVYDVVELYHDNVYKNKCGLMVTLDHRLVYNDRLFCNDKSLMIDNFQNLFNTKYLSIPTAGYFENTEGLGLSDDFVKFLVAVQADGHYIYNKLKNGNRSYYGVDFHFKKQRKIDRIKEILNNLKYKYSICNRSDGSTSIRVYNKKDFKIVDICEEYLSNKNFTEKLLTMNDRETNVFINELALWDGNSQNYYYTKNNRNFDVVSAICALHGRGTYINYKYRSLKIYNSPFTKLSLHNIEYRANEYAGRRTVVGCISVPSNLILIRQNGRTFIVGNCPGDFLYSRYGDIANKVNAILNGNCNVETVGEKNNNTSYKVKVNDDTGLNIRKGPGTNFDIVGKITDNGIYTIIEEASGKGAKKWGKLKSGLGYISLDYCKKI